jgi:hypothetical protein
VRGFSLHDIYDTPIRRPSYTHFTPTGASRLNRIYITEYLRRNKQGVETVPAAFTDYLVVVVGLSLESQSTLDGPGYWKMTLSLLRETDFLLRLRVEWKRWRKHAKNDPQPGSYDKTAK